MDPGLLQTPVSNLGSLQAQPGTISLPAGCGLSLYRSNPETAVDMSRGVA